MKRGTSIVLSDMRAVYEPVSSMFTFSAKPSAQGALLSN